MLIGEIDTNSLLHGADSLLILALVLVAGVLMGALFKRFHMPAVTGQILIGVLIGPSLAKSLDWRPVFDSHSIHALEPLTHFALGLVAVTVGSHLGLRRLRNAGKRLMWLLFFESLLTPVFVAVAVLMLREEEFEMAILLAALAVSTAPATVLALVKETRAKGVFVKTLVAGVALNNMACILLFELAHSATRATLLNESSGDMVALFSGPLRTLALSGGLGGAAGVLLILATRRVVNPDRLATASFISILLTSGLASFLDASPLLSCMFLGFALANLTPEKNEVGHAVFSDFESAIYAVFFTLAGMELDFSYIVPAGMIAIVMFVARGVGKIGAGWLAMKIAGGTDNVRKYLGMAMLPQAGVAVGLMLIIQDDSAFAGIKDLFLAVGLTVVTLNELVGPILTRVGLSNSGELGKDRARLIDFLHEENIVTELNGGTKEEVIEQLCSVLVQSNNLQMDPDAFRQSVMEREAEFSTCVGGGLAIPHGALTDGDGICGAMGISREGLGFETPDGRPVHCMVVLATPVTERDRHLEVLAALARAIGSDPSIQRQLFDAKSPAHAYEILHAEESEDFNYWLED